MRARAFPIVAALVLVAALPTPVASASKDFSCVWRSGPAYTFTLGGKTWMSRSYLLEGFNSTCTFAKHWVKKLAAKPYKGGTTPTKTGRVKMTGGPKGWQCWARFVPPAMSPKTTMSGICQNKKHKGRTFSWDPQSGDDVPVET